jgi:hypothetical protein
MRATHLSFLIVSIVASGSAACAIPESPDTDPALESTETDLGYVDERGQEIDICTPATTELFRTCGYPRHACILRDLLDSDDDVEAVVTRCSRGIRGPIDACLAKARLIRPCVRETTQAGQIDRGSCRGWTSITCTRRLPTVTGPACSSGKAREVAVQASFYALECCRRLHRSDCSDAKGLERIKFVASVCDRGGWTSPTRVTVAENCSARPRAVVPTECADLIHDQKIDFSSERAVSCR